VAEPGPGSQADPIAEEARGRPVRARRVGILGGSFDPPHRGHLHAARAARSAFELDELRFVPAARPPHKPGRVLAPARHRLRLLELLLAEEPGFTIDPRELDRPGPSFTVATLRELTEELPGQELFLVLGGDNLAGLADWRDVEEVLALARPIVVQREEDLDRALAAAGAKLSEAARSRLRAGLVREPPLEASSTELREALGAGAAPGLRLPPALRDYIEREGLYRDAPFSDSP